MANVPGTTPFIFRSRASAHRFRSTKMTHWRGCSRSITFSSRSNFSSFSTVKYVWRILSTVSTVGGVTAANVAAGANLANQSTSANTANRIVRRSASGGVSVGSLDLPFTASATSDAQIDDLVKAASLVLPAEAVAALDAASAG